MSDIFSSAKDKHLVELMEVNHGKWIGKPIAGYATVKCSYCGKTFKENTGTWKFCPECGTMMDLV